MRKKFAMSQYHDVSRMKPGQVEDAEVRGSEAEEHNYGGKDALPQDGSITNSLAGTSNKWLGSLQRTTDSASRRAIFRSMQNVLGNKASTVVARLYNEAKGVIQRVKISGYNMSNHGLERASERGISQSQIKAALDGGTQYDDGTDDHGVVFYLGDLAIVTNGSTIITVYRTPQANKPKARWTAL